MRGKSLAAAAAIALAASAALVSAPPAGAAFHLMVVQEVFPGTPSDPAAQFVELRMHAANQNQVQGHQIRFFAADGSPVPGGAYTFPAAVGNAAADDRILACTAQAGALFGLGCDLTINPHLTDSGKVAFDAIDAVAFGDYTGDRTGVGTPAGYLVRGRSLQREVTGGGSGDTNVSYDDFHYTAPSPQNNARAVRGLPPGDGDGDGIADAADNCPDASNAGQEDADGDGLGDVCDFGPDPPPPPPETSITSGPSGTVCVDTATFTFTSAPAGATFECSLDGALFGGCTSPKDYSGLSSATHTFQVRAVGAGGADPTPASRAWTVDTVPPDTFITAGPANGGTSGPFVTFSFISSEAGSTFVCTLDGGAEGCTSPKSYSGLALGAHTFSVVARDACGRSDPTADSRSWTVQEDVTPPQTTITSGPGEYSGSSTATFSFVSSEPGSTFACRLDGAGSTACSSPASFFNLSDGPHALDVWATDPSGNTDPTPARWSWSVDTTPGHAVLIGHDGACVSGAEVDVPTPRVVVDRCVVEAQASDAQSGIETVVFVEDGVRNLFGVLDPATGTWRATYRPASTGMHRLCARAINGAGLISEDCTDLLGVRLL